MKPHKVRTHFRAGKPIEASVRGLTRHDKSDLAEAHKRLKGGGPNVDWSKVKKDLGLTVPKPKGVN
jgi:hypothetical protein